MTINLRNKFSLLAILLIVTMGRVCAHALWIETSTIVKTGEKQFVKIVFSEPEDKPEKIVGWHSLEKDGVYTLSISSTARDWDAPTVYELNVAHYKSGQVADEKISVIQR